MSGTYPRLTFDAITALPSPQEGDMAYDLTFSCTRFYTGSKWVCTYQDPTNPTPNIAAIITAGGTSYDLANDIVVDASGNIYVTGYFVGTANFGGTSKTSSGNFDIFVAKYNSAGVLQWVQTAGGTSYDTVNRLALDASGNVFVTGSFQGTASFGGISKTSIGSSGIFVVKYNNSGVFQWVQTAGGTSANGGLGIAVDATGNVLVTGYFNGTANFGGTSKSSAGDYDVFVASYNSSGVLLWVQTAGGLSYDISSSIIVDANGKVLITGYFMGTINFGGISKTSAGSSDIFVAMYDPAVSSWSWVQQAGGTSDDRGEGIALDSSGNVFITGSFNGKANFSGISITSAGQGDVFVAKYNNSGSRQWVQSAGGIKGDKGQDIATDASGNIYITGTFQGTSNFGEISKTSAGLDDIFVTKYNNSGILQWVQTAGGTDSDYGMGIAIGINGNKYFTGSFVGTVNFGAKSKTSAGGTDIFVARIQD